VQSAVFDEVELVSRRSMYPPRGPIAALRPNGQGIVLRRGPHEAKKSSTSLGRVGNVMPVLERNPAWYFNLLASALSEEN
jgi:hypothetical protein